MASMLVRAFRGAGRAAPPAASAASRGAVVAAAASGAPADPNRLLRRFDIASGPVGRGLSSYCRDFPFGPPPGLNQPDSRPGKVEFMVDAKDLESDEALWDLYERWCKAFGEERSLGEMRRRFEKFKNAVRYVDRVNKDAIRDGRSLRLAVNSFADGKRRELMIPKVPLLNFRWPPSGKVLFRRPPPGKVLKGTAVGNRVVEELIPEEIEDACN